MIFQFEGFELDTHERELRKSGISLEIEPQVFDILLLLITHQGKLVTKDAIFETIWKGRIVSEAALSSRMSSARTAIGDNGKDQRLIKTIHGHGFRFIGEIKTSGETIAPAPPPTNISSLKKTSARPSLAVLPLNNMSSDPELEYVTDGLTEDIITALSKLSGIKVIARNSTFVYKGRAVDIRQVGQEQGVRYVLEGSLRRIGSQFRITGQLIDAETGAHVWAHRYDETAEDIFALQDEMTRAIVTALQIKLVDGEQARMWQSGTDNFKAWELTRQANALIGTQQAPKVISGQALIEEALLLDPDYAGAYLVKAQSLYAEVYDGWSTDPLRALREAKRALKKALSLNPQDPSALSLLAMTYMSAGQHDKAHQCTLEALKFGPSNAMTLNFAAAIFFYLGHYEEAEKLGKRSILHCPLDRASSLGLLACLYVVSGRSEEAITVAQTLMSVSAHYIYGPVALAAALSQLGRMEQAKDAARLTLELDSNFSSAAFLDSKPFKDKTATDGMRRAMIAAGLPA